MPILTISRELGSMGTVIADTLASRFGYSKLDKKSLEALLRTLGMPEQRFDEDEEKRPGFWEQFTLQKDRYLTFMKAAMYRFASEQECIIVGRGANVIFHGIPGALTMRIIAPLKVRAQRVRERHGIDEQEALRVIHQSDHDRAGYQRYFFNAAWDSPASYDLVVNTAAISPAETCDMVAALLRSPLYSGVGGRTRDILRDLRIAQDVVIAVLYRERVPAMFLDVVSENGAVSLHGRVRVLATIDRCVEIARTVEGVTSVASNLEVVEYAYYAGM